MIGLSTVELERFHVPGAGLFSCMVRRVPKRPHRITLLPRGAMTSTTGIVLSCRDGRDLIASIVANLQCEQGVHLILRAQVAAKLLSAALRRFLSVLVRPGLPIDVSCRE